jgi:hypothetical protein
MMLKTVLMMASRMCTRKAIKVTRNEERSATGRISWCLKSGSLEVLSMKSCGTSHQMLPYHLSVVALALSDGEEEVENYSKCK